MPQSARPQPKISDAGGGGSAQVLVLRCSGVRAGQLSQSPRTWLPANILSMNMLLLVARAQLDLTCACTHSGQIPLSEYLTIRVGKRQHRSDDERHEHIVPFHCVGKWEDWRRGSRETKAGRRWVGAARWMTKCITHYVICTHYTHTHIHTHYTHTICDIYTLYHTMKSMHYSRRRGPNSRSALISRAFQIWTTDTWLASAAGRSSTPSSNQPPRPNTYGSEPLPINPKYPPHPKETLPRTKTLEPPNQPSSPQGACMAHHSSRNS